MERAVFCLSLDTELYWGVFPKMSLETFNRTYRGIRESIDRLLGLFETYGISASWNIVGAIFLREYSGEDGKKFPRLVRPAYDWYQMDWLERMPLGSVETAPMWYGRDIVEKIMACAQPQEIGMHGFAHMLWGDPGFSVENARSELEHARLVTQELGIKPESFVFPDNQEAHHEVLAEFGYIAYRGRELDTDEHSTTSRLARPLKQFMAVKPRVWEPVEKIPGLWNIPASMFLPHFDFPYAFIPVGRRIRRALKGVSEAIRQKKIFHLWFHPYNMGCETEKFFFVLESIFKTVRAEMDSGNILNMTMSSIAREAVSRKAHGPAS